MSRTDGTTGYSVAYTDLNWLLTNARASIRWLLTHAPFVVHNIRTVDPEYGGRYTWKVTPQADNEVNVDMFFSYDSAKELADKLNERAALIIMTKGTKAEEEL